MFGCNATPATRCLIAVAATLALMLLPTLPAQAQAKPTGVLDCLPPGQPLPPIPELVSDKGVLRGTIVLSDENQRIPFRSPPGIGHNPGTPGLYQVCYQQRVRTFRGVGAQPQPPARPGQVADPMPGPTLRAKLGDIIELTFLNQIDPNRFPYSIDQAEKGGGTGCDSSTGGYPTAGGDAFPDCLHGSSTGNIHFHGTHTNPNSTGDNVFLQVRPSPIVNGAPTVTEASVKQQFAQFFTACENQLKNNPLAQWPQTWNDPPLGPPTPTGTNWTSQQMKLLQAYDADKPPAQKLWPIDEDQWKNKGLWPQYYIGAVPYCFHLPKYTANSFPPPQGGPRMGQAPGTHWYHAHKHGSTAINVANGMTGVFIIEGGYDDALNGFYGTVTTPTNPPRQVPWTRAQPVLVINQLGVTPNLLRSNPVLQPTGGFTTINKGNTDKGPDFAVNGRLQPIVDMRPGEVQMWRIANTSGRSGAFFLGPPPGFEWRQLAQDGVQFTGGNYETRLKNHNGTFLMAAGNRVDLLVKAPLTPAVYPVIVQHEVDPSDLKSAYPVVLLYVRIKADAQPVPNSDRHSQFIPADLLQASFPPFLRDIEWDEFTNPEKDPITGQKADDQVVKFASTGPGYPPYSQHTINDAKFNPDVVGEKVWLNRVEQWKIVNASLGVSHPFHIHINPFQITEVFDPNQQITIPDPKDKTKTIVVSKYVVDQGKFVDKDKQCLLDPNDQKTWYDCHNVVGPNRIWWDVFPIPSGINPTGADGKPINGPDGKPLLIPGYFRMQSRFVDFSGWYVLHCHILAHEDRGMMTVVEVRPLLKKDEPPQKLPFSHH